MEVSFDLDLEGMEEEPWDILGNITISSGDNVIQDEVVFIDRWLACLIVGVIKIDEIVEFKGEVLEPYPLLIKKRNNSVEITYSNSKIYIDNIDQFKKILIDSSKKLLEIISKYWADYDLKTLLLLECFLIGDYSKVSYYYDTFLITK